MLQRFSKDLTALQRAIRWDSGDELFDLFDLFTKTRAIRRRIIGEGQDDAAADFGRAQDCRRLTVLQSGDVGSAPRSGVLVAKRPVMTRVYHGPADVEKPGPIFGKIHRTQSGDAKARTRTKTQGQLIPIDIVILGPAGLQSGLCN